MDLDFSYLPFSLPALVFSRAFLFVILSVFFLVLGVDTVLVRLIYPGEYDT